MFLIFVMKTPLSFLKIAALGLLAVPLVTQAEDGKPGHPPGGGRPGEHMDPAERLKMMSEKLGLSEDQKEKIKAIFAKDGPAMKELMSKGRENLSEDDKAKLKEMMKANREEIATVLTPEQLAKMKEGRGPKPGGDAPKK